MNYVAIARKWRPQSFEDVVGQPHVVQTLQNAIAHNRVTHAYLFSGPRGVGKTSVARIFAKSLRCTQPEVDREESLAIAEGRSLDVVEIDGASNNGVEAVRSLRENIAYGASTGNYKIYIIDEVHMLSMSAFNALLKTLEEPPAHVIFVLATTEVQKIPLTILSRCQRFEFRRLSNQQIVSRLQKILENEKVSISDEGLRIISSQSDGALRDAQSLLDQVISSCGSEGESIQENQIIEALGISDTRTVRKFLENIFEANFSEIFKTIEDTYFSGLDLKHFAEKTLEELRSTYLLLLAKEAKETLTPEALDISVSHFSELEKLAEKASLSQVERMTQILSKVISQLHWASLPRFVLEMGAFRMARLQPLTEIETALRSGVNTPEKEPLPEAPQKSSVKREEKGPADYRAKVGKASGGDTWSEFVQSVMKKRPLLGALLSHANFKLDTTSEGNEVTLAFDVDSFYEKQATETKNKSDIDSLLKSFFGPKTSVTISTPNESMNSSLEKTKQASDAALKKKALEHPAVQEAKETLGAEVVSVNIEN